MVDSSFNLLGLIVLVVGWLVLFGLVFWAWTKSRGQRAQQILSPSMTSTPMGGGELLGNDGGEGVILAVEVPKENQTTPLAAELMFASLHGIYRPANPKTRSIQDHISFEVQAKEKSIRFFVWTPKHLQGYVEGQIYAQYPGVLVREFKDYADLSKLKPGASVAAAELKLVREDLFPIKSFDSFDVDPLSGITATLSKLEGDAQIWVQVLIRPESDSWRNRAVKYIADLKAGKKGFGATLAKQLGGLASDVVRTAVSGPQESASAEKKTELPPGMDEVLKKIEEKSTKLGFQTFIRILAIDDTAAAAQQKLDLVVGSFKQFNTTNLNGFTAVPEVTVNGSSPVDLYAGRIFPPVGFIMNVTELASIYHLPNTTVTTPHIVWAGAKKGEPPANLPLADETPSELLTVLGVTNFRGSQEKFGVKIVDRRRHVYVVGKSGTGKSTFLENMTMDDVMEGRGVGVVDPHGEYVDYVLERIPDNRIEDVIVFDPSDKEHPIGFNILEVEDPKYKLVTASGVVGVFKKIFGESWGPRLEYWLNSAILALLDYPGATLVMVPRLFVDDAFREEVIAGVQDPIIKNRWITEYNKLDQKQRSETISPILNKVGQFLSSAIIRNIVGQPKSSINIRRIMDDGKIMLVKLSKGLIGEDNAALLGALIITKMQLSAMSRADTEVTTRRDFFLYVDEFQNFATDSFATILSEARKYGLSLTMAHQYIAQLSEVVSKAVFGNVGTLVAFRVGSDDAGFLTKEFAPVFTEQDLVNLDVFNIYLKLSIDGMTAGAFSAMTLPPSAQKNDNRDKVVELSRQKYSTSAEHVEEGIRTHQAGTVGQRPPATRPSGQPIPPTSPSGGRYGGASRPPMRSGGGNPNGAPKQSPNITGLKSLISSIEKKKQEKLAPEQKEEIAKTIMEDMKNEPTSFREAMEKAKQQPPATSHKPQGERDQGTGARGQGLGNKEQPKPTQQTPVMKPQENSHKPQVESGQGSGSGEQMKPAQQSTQLQVQPPVVKPILPVNPPANPPKMPPESDGQVPL